MRTALKQGCTCIMPDHDKIVAQRVTFMSSNLTMPEPHVSPPVIGNPASVTAAAAPLQLTLPAADAEISPARIGRLGRRALFGRSAADVIPPGTAVAAAAAAVVDAYERQAALQVCKSSDNLINDCCRP